MSEHSFIKRRWKLILNIVTLIALLLAVYLTRDQIAQTIDNFAKVHAWTLLLILPVEYLNYDSQTRLYQSLWSLLGRKLAFWETFKMSLELNFVNHVFPSGGVSGISYYGVRMRSGKVTGSEATMVQLVKLGLLFISFEILLVLGLFLLAVAGQANNLTILVAASLSTLLVVGTALFAYIIGSKQRIDMFFTAITQFINKVIHIFTPKQPETINISRAKQVFGDLHHTYKQIETRWKDLRRPLFWAFVANLTEVLTVYVVFLAFGERVNIGAVILAYAVANFAGLISVLPGGIGIYEALMTAVLAAAGIPAGVSLPVIVMYRVINTLIQLPPGYYYYHKNLSAAKE